MSVQDVKNAAKVAEEAARALAASVIAAGVAQPDSEVAQIRAETAALIISSAEKRARFVIREEAEKKINDALEAGEELLRQAEEGLIGRDEAIERLDRLEAIGFRLWSVTHERDVWEAALANCRTIGREPPRGAR